jgi:hypothetical protein
MHKIIEYGFPCIAISFNGGADDNMRLTIPGDLHQDFQVAGSGNPYMEPASRERRFRSRIYQI